MHRWRLFFPILLLAPLFPGARVDAQSVQNEGLVRTLGPEWKSLYSISRNLSYDAINLVRNGDTVYDWKELVTLQDFAEPTRLSPDEVLTKLKEKSEKDCPGLTQWKVIAKADSSILYEWHSDPCGKWPEQVEIARVILGTHSWYVLHYSARVHELAPDIRSQWIKTFSDATFDSVTSSFDPAWMSVDVDETIPFAMDKAMAALETAMESQDCKVSQKSAGQIECKRSRASATWTKGTSGGESVTGKLEAQGDKTHVVVTTGFGFYARQAKKNYSTPIFEAMLKNLQKAQP